MARIRVVKTSMTRGRKKVQPRRRKTHPPRRRR